MSSVTDLVDVKNLKKFKNKPNLIADTIVKIAKDIEDSKDDIHVIKNRGFIKRVFNNNTRDIAEVLEKQNSSLQYFMEIMQGLIGLCTGNTVMLAGVIDALASHEDAKSLSGNRYLNIAEKYLEESLKAAKLTNDKLKAHSKSLIEIKDDLIKKTLIDEEQSKLISQIDKNLIEKKRIDEEQTQRINQLHSSIAEKKKIDDDQNAKINEIIEVLDNKDIIDNKQSDDIESIKKIAVNNKDLIDQLSSSKDSDILVLTNKITELRTRNRNFLILNGLASIVIFCLVLLSILNII